MNVLSFTRTGEVVAGREIRRARFEQRSTLAVSAACLVANAARDVLSNAFGCPVELRLFEPTIPSVGGWSAIGRDARLYRVSGLRIDAALVVRDTDALAIARAAFSEFRDERGALSPMEASVLDRIVASLAQVLPALNGRMSTPEMRRVDSIDGYTTFFELHIVRPIDARIGVALAKEPDLTAQAAFLTEVLDDVEVELAVRTTPVVLTAGQLAELALGEIVTFGEGAGFTVALAGRSIARGECGIVGDRYALRIVE